MDQESAVRQTIESLSQWEIFADLTGEQLNQLVALGEIVTYPPDLVLFREGDEGDKLFLILEGSIEVSNEGDKQIFLLSQGDLLGEIALLDGLPRTATVTTASPCKLFGLSRAQFAAFLAFDPNLAMNLMTVTNRKVRAALEREKQLNASLREANEELERLNHDLESLVEQKTQQLRLANQNLKEMLERDALTGTYNRRKFDTLMEERAQAAQPFALIMLDIDFFKKLNDTYGHQIGDRVLMTLAQVAGEDLMNGYYLTRYGGEEFAFVLEGADLASASKLAEKVRSSIENHHFPIRGCTPGFVTASLGVAHFPTHAERAEVVLKLADEALYRAKNEGRNRVAVAGDK